MQISKGQLEIFLSNSFGLFYRKQTIETPDHLIPPSFSLLLLCSIIILSFAPLLFPIFHSLFPLLLCVQPPSGQRSRSSQEPSTRLVPEETVLGD